MKKKLLAFAVAFIAMTGLAGTADSLRLNAYAQETSVVQQAEAKAPVLSAKTNGKAVKVTFNAVENAKSYQLYRQALSEADVDALVFSTEEQKTSYTFNDTETDTCVNYTYYVKAVFEDGSETVSEKASAYAGLDTASAKVSAQAEGSITLQLAKVENANRYRVYIVDLETGIKTGLARLVNGKTEYTYKKAAGGNVYKFYVVADNVLDDGTVVSGKGSYVQASQPIFAPKFTLKASADTAQLSWKASSGADWYKIYKYDTAAKKWKGVRTLAATKTSYTVKGLEIGKEHTFVVRAAADTGTGLVFDKKMAEPQTMVSKLATPDFTGVSFRGRTVTVSWKQVSGASGYHIYMYDAAKKKYVLYKGVAAGRSSYSSSSKIKLGSTYKFKIRAFKKLADGTVAYSVFSGMRSATPKVRIVIDPGHIVGGNAWGTEYDNVVSGYSEAKMSTALSHYMRDYLESYGIEVKLTREEETAYYLDLKTRGYMAEGYDFFLALHSNAGGTSQNAVYAFCCVDGKADAIGAKLTAAIAKTMGVTDGGVVHRYSDDYPGQDYYCVVRAAKAVGVSGILMEHSYHTNPSVRAWLMDQNNLKKLGKAEADVIAKYFGVI